MIVRPYKSIKANILLNISEIPRKQTAFATNGSPRHLNIVLDFDTGLFSFQNEHVLYFLTNI